MIHKRLLPPLGHRIIKTAVAVYICLLIYMLRGYRGAVAQSAIAAIICMQPYVEDSKAYAYERIYGTVLGSAWGFLFLLLMRSFPVLSISMVTAYFVMSFVIILAVYSTVLVKKPSTATQVAIAYLGVVLAYPNVQAPLAATLNTLIDTAIGTFVAITVNVAHLPRKKHPEYLFFLRTMDLVPDRYAQIPSSVHITLDHLYKDGAKICLVSRWAPAFIISQMGLLHVNAPVIVMDGAGLYDIEENKYIDVFEIPKINAKRLCSIIKHFGASCNIYALQDRSMCIYHEGDFTDAEQQEYKRLKRSPYRNYMEGTYHDTDKIAFIRVIDTPEKISELAHLVQSVLPPGMFRMDIRDEAQSNYRGIYFYAPTATQANMKKRVLEYMQQQSGTELEPIEILPHGSNYLPEHDAMLLLGRVKSIYEPVSFLPHKKRKNA